MNQTQDKIRLNYFPIISRFIILIILFVPWAILFSDYKDMESHDACPQLGKVAQQFYQYYLVVSCLILPSILLQYLMIRHNATECSQSSFYWYNYVIHFVMGAVGLLLYISLIEAYRTNEEGCSRLRSLALANIIFNASFLVISLLIPMIISGTSPDLLERLESPTRGTEPYFQPYNPEKNSTTPNASDKNPEASSRNPIIALSSERYEISK